VLQIGSVHAIALNRSGPAQISTLAGIDLDLFAFVNERRHLHHQAGLRFGGFSHARSRRRLESRLGLDNGKLDGAGSSMPTAAVVIADLDLQVGS